MPGPYKFGKVSRANLEGLDPDMVMLAEIAIEYWDCTVVDGVRTYDEQVKNVAKGVSTTMNSMHFPRNEKGEIDWKKGLGRAMDIQPYPMDWKAVERGMRAVLAENVDPKGSTLEMYMFAGFIMGIAAAKGIRIRSGADWDSDRDISNQSFHDLPHHEKVMSDSHDGR